VKIRLRNTTWEFCWGDEWFEFPNQRSALQFLLPLKGNSEFMSQLRFLLAERNPGFDLSRLSDQGVLEEIALRLGNRQLRLRYAPDLMQEGGATTEEKPAVQAEPLPPPPRQPAAPPEPTPDEPVFVPNIDAAAIAAAMREAAQSGVPFCEE
jgi:hypothetical protein